MKWHIVHGREIIDTADADNIHDARLALKSATNVVSAASWRIGFPLMQDAPPRPITPRQATQQRYYAANTEKILAQRKVCTPKATRKAASDRAYYLATRAAKLAYQKNYRATHLAAVRSRDRVGHALKRAEA